MKPTATLNLTPNKRLGTLDPKASYVTHWGRYGPKTAQKNEFTWEEWYLVLNGQTVMLQLLLGAGGQETLVLYERQVEIEFSDLGLPIPTNFISGTAALLGQARRDKQSARLADNVSMGMWRTAEHVYFMRDGRVYEGKAYSIYALRELFQHSKLRVGPCNYVAPQTFDVSIQTHRDLLTHLKLFSNYGARVNLADVTTQVEFLDVLPKVRLPRPTDSQPLLNRYIAPEPEKKPEKVIVSTESDSNSDTSIYIFYCLFVFECFAPLLAVAFGLPYELALYSGLFICAILGWKYAKASDVPVALVIPAALSGYVTYLSYLYRNANGDWWASTVSGIFFGVLAAYLVMSISAVYFALSLPDAKEDRRTVAIIALAVAIFTLIFSFLLTVIGL